MAWIQQLASERLPIDTVKIRFHFQQTDESTVDGSPVLPCLLVVATTQDPKRSGFKCLIKAMIIIIII